jgi:hypothetical protein
MGNVKNALQFFFLFLIYIYIYIFILMLVDFSPVEGPWLTLSPSFGRRTLFEKILRRIWGDDVLGPWLFKDRAYFFYNFMGNAYTRIPRDMRWDIEERMVAVAAISRTNVVIPGHKKTSDRGEGEGHI